MASKDVFISHSSKDNEVAQKIVRLLDSNGISTWLDLNDIPADGGVFAGHITQGLNSAKVFLLILSSSANASPHVLNEINMAFSNRLPFVIYNLDLSENDFTDDLKYYLASKQFIKVSELGEQKSQQMLLTYIKERLRGDPPRSVPVVKEPRREGQGASLKLKIFTAVLCAFSAGSLINAYAPDMLKMSQYHPVNFQTGDIMQLGSYHGQPLLWVYAGTNQTTGEPSFISRSLIAAKPFDVAHSGSFRTDRSGLKDHPSKSMKIGERSRQYTAETFVDMYGSADYEDSTIRAWLNSKDNSVRYPGPKPVLTSIDSTGTNKYLVSKNLDNMDEGGFLTNFTPQELEILKPVTVRYMVTAENRTKAVNKDDHTAVVWRSIRLFPNADTLTENDMTLMLRKFRSINFRNYYYREVKDLVTIPSLEEISQVYSNKDLNLQNQFDNARVTGEGDNPMDNSWWTRTPCGMMPYTVCAVHPAPLNSSSGDMQVTPTTVSTLATVRPVIHAKTESMICTGDGSKAAPYTCRIR